MSEVPSPELPRVALKVANVAKSYGPTRALKGIDIDVRAGEIMSLVGGNGSGKSTLVKSLAGVVRPDSGTLTIRGEDYDLTGFSPADSRGCGLHMVHQHRTIFESMTVMENLAIGNGFDLRGSRTIDWTAVRRNAEKLIEAYGIGCRPEDLAGDLRPASQTMLEIARALGERTLSDDSVLVLDEPTASLPPHEVDFLLESLVQCRQDGQSVLFISHRLEEVLQISDRVTCLTDGEIRGVVPASELDREGLVELIAGKSVSIESSPVTYTDTEDSALRVEGLTGHPVQDISFRVAPGQIVGIAGLAGSGRSSLLRMLFGAQKFTEGTVTVGGQSYVPRDPKHAIGSGIAFVPEDRNADAVFPELSISENLTIKDLGKFATAGRIRRPEIRAAGTAAIRDFGVKAHDEATAITHLSGGNAQKVSLARWLFDTNPDVLLLDEPTQGVDVSARSDIWEILRAAAAEGTAILVVSSDLEELVHLAHQLLIMRDGRIVGTISTEGLTPEDVNQRILGLEAGA